MKRRLACLSLLTVVAVMAACEISVAEITAERSHGGVVVKIDGQPFTEYVVDMHGTPILWPLIGPTGKPMTRSYPMAEVAGEKTDHPHHRSLWFTHGDVNGLSFWDKDTIRHREFAKIQSGREAIVVTRNDWLDRSGKPVCEDERTFTFGVEGDSRRIDFDITIRPSAGPVKFGDTKEGTMGVRVAETMMVDAKLGGRIVNSNGQTDGDAWAKRATWVDYQGPIDGETLGIAILNHPSSYGFPTYWHVRTYGLFAANPFGVRDFTGDKAADGSHTVEPGESMTFHYRILLHRGDEKAGKIAEAYSNYAKKTQ